MGSSHSPGCQVTAGRDLRLFIWEPEPQACKKGDLGSKTIRPLKGKAVKSQLRLSEAVKARRLLCELAVQAVGQSGAEGAPFVGVTTSAVAGLAASRKLPEFRKSLKAL